MCEYWSPLQVIRSDKLCMLVACNLNSFHMYTNEVMKCMNAFMNTEWSCCVGIGCGSTSYSTKRLKIRRHNYVSANTVRKACVSQHRLSNRSVLNVCDYQAMIRWPREFISRIKAAIQSPCKKPEQSSWCNNEITDLNHVCIMLNTMHMQAVD